MILNAVKQERLLRVFARGEHSGHAHVLIGPATNIKHGENGEVTFEVPEDADVKLRHLLEEAWVNRGEQVSIYDKQEGRDGHKDIQVAPGKYKFIRQEETDPLTNKIRQVMD